MSTESDPFTARFQATRTPSGNIVIAGESLEVKTQALSHLRNLLWLGIPAAFAITMALVWLLTGAALRPVDRLRRDATSLSENRPDLRLPVPATGDEIERLALTLNDMLDRLWTAAERERRLVDDASHELRTPLAILQTEIELALRGERTNDELEGALRSAAEETDRLSRLAEDLLVLARSNRGLLTVAPEPTDMQALVAAVVSERKALATGAGPRIDIAAVEPSIANIDPVWIRQVLRNLLDNAVRHTPELGSVEVRVVRDGEGVIVSVLDDGPGFAPDALERVFEPFARADPARTRRSGGAGLGLSIVQAVVVAHGGSVSARNRDVGGAAVEVRLPSSNLMPVPQEHEDTQSRH
jgi:heavy metal sensor kinase